MSTRNLILSILAFIILGYVLIKGLATAWMAVKLLPFICIIVVFVIVGWLWGRFSK